MRRVIVVTVMVLGSVLAGSPGFGSPMYPPGAALAHSAAANRPAITAFQEDGDANSLITRSAAALTTVGVDGVDISANGAQVSKPSRAALRSLQVAHDDGLKAEFLIGNWDNQINDFSEANAHHLLDSRTHISRVARSLAHSAISEGWDGISVDLESLTGRDRAGLVRFLDQLRADLPASKSLSMCVTNYTSVSTFHRTGYNLQGIGEAVNTVTLMAYDQHGPWENTPGPIGALSWQKAGLHVVRQFIPAAKIELGEAGYGYAWRPHSNDQLSDAGARRLVRRDGATAHWNAEAGEWTAQLSDGSTLWWADARSFTLRVALARRDHLHGLAVWDLGLSDRIH